MFYYFIVQYRMLNRRITESGIKPLVGYILLTAAFITGSLYLFEKTVYAIYIYSLSGLWFVMPFAEKHRNSFLKSCYPLYQYRMIRLIENLLAVLPFLIFMLYKEAYLFALVSGLIAAIASLLQIRHKSTFVIRTPFYKRPFEFIAGFRKNWYIVLFTYFLLIMAIIANNLNLGIFSGLLLIFITGSFYFIPEDTYFVWIHKASPAGFLREKIKTASLQVSLLCFPVLVCLGFFFTPYLLQASGIFLLGYGYLIMVILAKYAAYPGTINLPFAILMAGTIAFPPSLPLVIIYCYFLSVKKLKNILV